MHYLKRNGPKLVDELWPNIPDEQKALFDKYGIGDYVRATIDGEFRKKHPILERAIVTSGDGGNLVPEVWFGKVIDNLVEQTKITRVGSQVITLDKPAGTYTFPTIDRSTLDNSTTLSLFTAEGSTDGEIAVTFSEVQLTPYYARGRIRFSVELMQDAPYFNQMLESEMTKQFVHLIDKGCLVGSTDGTMPIGLLRESLNAINTFNSTSPTSYSNSWNMHPYAHVAQGVSELLLRGTEPEMITGAIMHPSVRFGLESLYDLNFAGQTKRLPILDGIPFVACGRIEGGICEADGTTSFTSILLGNFNDHIIGMRQELRLQWLSERDIEYGLLSLQGSLRFDHVLLRTNSLIRLMGWPIVANSLIDPTTYATPST